MIHALTTLKSAEELTQAQSGLEGSTSLPPDILLWVIYGLVFSIVLGLILFLVRRRRSRDTFIGLDSITDSKRINIILQRAVARQASCRLEIFDHRHRNIYHGKIGQAFAGYHLLMKLSQLPPANSDFDSFPAQLHLYFRPSSKEGIEHYQFSSHTLSSVVSTEGDEQVAGITMAWPKSIISSQQRTFMRVEPRRDLPLTIKVLTAPQAGALPRDLEGLPFLGKGYVVDLSVGGVQFMLKGSHQFAEGQNLLLSLELSSHNSHMEKDSQPYHLNLILEPLSTDFITANDSAGSPASDNSDDYTVVRGKFTGRYNFLAYGRRWERVDFNLENFKDFAQWIQGYQRFILQNENTLNLIEVDTSSSASLPSSAGLSKK